MKYSPEIVNVPMIVSVKIVLSFVIDKKLSFRVDIILEFPLSEKRICLLFTRKEERIAQLNIATPEVIISGTKAGSHAYWYMIPQSAVAKTRPTCLFERICPYLFW